MKSPLNSRSFGTTRHQFLAVLLLPTLLLFSFAQDKKADAKTPKKKVDPPFAWVNPAPASAKAPVKHETFRSPSMGEQVGYCIFFPPGYDKPTNAKRRYPVVYFLHGGRPGNEWKCVSITHQLKTSMQERKVAPAIYVFVNGGKVSHYNTPQFDSMGEDVFVKELIPHVDNTHRTIAARHGRALEGFSQGGRGTARIAFKHPHVFCSAAPGGAGYATEKKISESGGHESERLFFGPGYNTWDLAAKHKGKPDGLPALMIYVGTKGFNYENNLDYMTYLEGLGIPFQRLVVPGAKHSLKEIYEANGIDLMRFHATNFKAATAAEKSKE